MAQKQFHIVKIINDSEFVINAGFEDTNVGDKFNIIGYSSEEIIDPVTDEPLGRIATSKGTIEVTRVFEKMSIASSGLTYINPLAHQFMTNTPMFDMYKQERIRLNVDLNQVSGVTTRTDAPIQIGDDVVKLGNTSNLIND